jgi:hypothetical protein
MIYLDDLLPSHRKILRAGALIGDAHGGRCAALGLFVAAIGYARQYLTDGVVPDEFLLETARAREPISALHAAKLLRKLRGNRWQIHDFHQWNPLSAEVLHKRAVNRERLARWRAQKRDNGGNGNALRNALRTHYEHTCNTSVTLPPYPLSPNHVRTYKNADPAGPTFPQPVENSRLDPGRRPAIAVLAALTRDVLATHPDLDEGDLIECIKTAAAQAKLRYTGQAVLVALRRARAQRAKGVA